MKIKVYTTHCVRCRQVEHILVVNNVSYERIDCKGMSLDDIKLLLGSDYDSGLKWPIVYLNGKFQNSIYPFLKKVDKRKK